MSKCTGCMECESVCPLTPFGYGIGPIIRKYIEGKENELSTGDEIWQCTMCFSCDDACPEGFKPRDMIIKFRQMSKNCPSAYNRLIAHIRTSGKAFSLKGDENRDYLELFRMLSEQDLKK